jgi:hypothetical protein
LKIFRIICASCVLFGPHQKHDILSLKDGAEYLRDNIHLQLKRGTLKKEFSESHLLEIREYHLRMEKYKNDTVKKVDEIFKEIITTLKKRKNELITDILEKFTNERDKILGEENLWIDKQDISERLLSLMNDPDDQNILVNSKFIMGGIRKINEKLSFKEIKVYNDLDTSLTVEKVGMQNITLSHEEIIYYLSKYLTIADPNILEFKA